MRAAPFAIAAALLAAAPAVAGEAPKSVVELFTSQGCSSCPPADRMANDLAHEGRALVLTLPVDYWDYLGWKDTLANPANTARQRAYAMARADRKVYTPQIVVNGREAAIGGDGEAVEAAIERAEQAGFELPVEVSVADGRLSVEVSRARRPVKDVQAEVWAFAFDRTRQVEIARGENAGRNVTYANVVRHMTRLGVWDGTPAKFEVPADEVLNQPDADGVAVLVQVGNGGRPGAILGAARLELATAPAPAPAGLVSRIIRDPY